MVGSERLTGAVLYRLTHHMHILEMNDQSCRLKHGRPSDAMRNDVRLSNHDGHLCCPIDTDIIAEQWR